MNDFALAGAGVASESRQPWLSLLAKNLRRLDIRVHARENLGALYRHASSATGTALLDITVCHRP